MFQKYFLKIISFYFKLLFFIFKSIWLVNIKNKFFKTKNILFLKQKSL
jgi:hypothetical protein